MKRLKTVLPLLAAIWGGGYWLYTICEGEIASAVASAVAAESIRHNAEIAKLKETHKKKIAKVKAKERAKAKIQRGISSIPFMGIAAFGLFEANEFENWKKENPGGTFEEYTAEISHEVAELFAGQYQEYSEYYQSFLATLENEEEPMPKE